MSKSDLRPVIVIQAVTLKTSYLNFSGPFAVVIFDVPLFTWGALAVMGYYPASYPFWLSPSVAISKSVAWIFPTGRSGLTRSDYCCKRPGKINLQQEMGQGLYATPSLTQEHLVRLHYQSFSNPVQTAYRPSISKKFPAVARRYVETRKSELAKLSAYRPIRYEL